MSANIASRLETGTPYLKDLIADINSGQIKVPQFQRQFVWKEEQALKLLDSIASNYPVGSLLLWRTKNSLAVERNIGAFKLPETDDMSPTDYVLDGQQRLTVIYSALGALEGQNGFDAAYDLVEDCFMEAPEDFSQTQFPLRIIYNTTKLLNFRSGLVSYPNADELQEKLDGLIDVITNYRIPVVTLKELTVEEVCPIFERINSSGTRLSTYDLMVAATWTESFDLNEEAQKIANSLKPKGFDDIDGNTVLKCLSAIKHKGIKKEQVLSLRNLSKDEMDSLVEIAKAALLKTIDLLKTEFKIYSWDFLPYEAIAVVLSYVFSKRKTLTLEDVRRVRKWFWLSAFSERYRGASESFVSQDLEAIDSFVINGEDPKKSFGSIPTQEAFKKLAFRSNNSRSRALIILLALKRPRNITNGAVIDPEIALSNYNSKQFHHIYPKAHLKRINASGEHNSLANFCMLAASENNAISDDHPNEYLPHLISELGKEVVDVFNSNYLPDPRSVDFSTLEYPEFIDLRAKLMLEDINKLTNGESI
ncbi:GmrSD restriction endonuclease domain-containing protein [Microbulbifer sp. PAAF003]|uniref:GmrSD restriction endonuclease domain-containing protein n=1 Tax=Microbulbifer sp. PAAF003 TaxID=3243375 RepID=UPI00403A7869